MVFSLLNLLVSLAHNLLEFGDRLYQQCRVGESRRGLWTLFRSAFYLIEFDTWEALLRYHLRETAAGPYRMRQTEIPRARSGKKLIVTPTLNPLSQTEGRPLLVAFPPAAAYDSGQPQLAAPASMRPTQWRPGPSYSPLIYVGASEVSPA